MTRLPSVVLVDDTLDIRWMVRIALERGGFEVVAEAADGEAGVAAVVAARPDAVLLDVAMPKMDGLEALTQIKAEVPDTTVVMLSGFVAPAVMEAAMERGAAGYIRKGVPLTEIVSRLRELMKVEHSA